MGNQVRFWLKRTAIRIRQINSFNKVRVFFYDALTILNDRLPKKSLVLQKICRRGLERACLYATKKLSPYFDGEKYNFNGIYLPYKKENTLQLWDVAQDVFFCYLHNADNYDAHYVNKLDRKLPEGVYCYSDGNAKILISKGNVVLDLGAWIGDFSAYACHKGATVYAFEPSIENRIELEKTKAYNWGEIIIEPFGVGEKTQELFFATEGNSAGLSFAGDKAASGEMLQVVALDDWVKDKEFIIDFIKADIEGYERNMLRGARNILKEHQPILSLCTYHLPDDLQVLSNIILESNPNYRIIKRRMKLFAYVPK